MFGQVFTVDYRLGRRVRKKKLGRISCKASRSSSCGSLVVGLGLNHRDKLKNPKKIALHDAAAPFGVRKTPCESSKKTCARCQSQ